MFLEGLPFNRGEGGRERERGGEREGGRERESVFLLDFKSTISETKVILVGHLLDKDRTKVIRVGLQ